jgi:hypothetical protein
MSIELPCEFQYLLCGPGKGGKPLDKPLIAHEAPRHAHTHTHTHAHTHTGAAQVHRSEHGHLVMSVRTSCVVYQHCFLHSFEVDTGFPYPLLTCR